jgi:hypothetical protein
MKGVKPWSQRCPRAISADELPEELAVSAMPTLHFDVLVAVIQE